MRDIKFRGKRVDTGKWVEGDLSLRNRLHSPVIYANEAWEYVVDPATVGQYTGLKDKNGKEGCESDKLDTAVGMAVICFGEHSQGNGSGYHVGFYLQFEKEVDAAVYRKDVGYWLPRSEIVGTIHDKK